MQVPGIPPPAEKFLVKVGLRGYFVSILPALRGGRADRSSGLSQGRLMEIRNVWAENLEIELANMRKLVDKYCYVAMVRQINAY